MRSISKSLNYNCCQSNLGSRLGKWDHFDLRPDLDLTCDLKKKTSKTSLKCTRITVGRRLARLATAISSEDIAWGYLMTPSPEQVAGGEIPQQLPHKMRVRSIVFECKEPKSEPVQFGWSRSQSHRDILHEGGVKLFFGDEIGVSNDSPKYHL